MIQMPLLRPCIDKDMIVQIVYTNWKGETSTRRIIPQIIEFTSTEWHPEKQFILFACDVVKGDIRGFAMKDIHDWKQENLMNKEEI